MMQTQDPMDPELQPSAGVVPETEGNHREADEQTAAEQRVDFSPKPVKRHRATDVLREHKMLATSLLLFFTVLWVPPVYLLKFGKISVRQYRKGAISDVVHGPKEAGWVALSQVSKFLSFAIITSEDGRFRDHWGIDFMEMLDSFKTNWAHGRYKRGASTISQQLVKVSLLARDKTIIRKLREASGTVLMESIMSKDEILEWYLNLVEFGPNLYGVRAAAQYYFGTSPRYLSLIDSIHLALVLPSPSAWSYGLRQRQLTRFGKKRFRTILQNMRGAGFINESQYGYAKNFGDFGRPI